jgi:hypothetical protein
MRLSIAQMVMALGIMIVLCLPSISAEGQTMEKIDPHDDVQMMGSPFAEKNEVSEDIEIFSASIDWSGTSVVCEFTVKGEARNISSDDSVNAYFFNIDLTTETNEEEIAIVFTDTGLTGVSTETGMIFMNEDDFTSVDGTFRFEFEKSHFGSYSEVLDIEVRAQNANGWWDVINWDEGFPDDDDDDDTADDDTSDDDTADDDTSDDDGSDDDDDSPGFSFILLLIASAFTLILIGYRKRRD